jgi:hypothetical protein
MIRSLTAMALGAGTLLMASSAFAQTNVPPPPPPPAASSSASAGASASSGAQLAHPISAALLLGYGFNNVNDSGVGDSVNVYGLGIGVRGGYSLAIGGPGTLYVGGTFIYHLGYSKDVGTSSLTSRVSPLGVEGGYDFTVAPGITVRPFLGLGLAFYSSTVSFGGLTQDNGGSKFALWPGVEGMYDITEQIFVGADLRYTIVTGANGGSPNAPGIYLNGGYRF